MNWQDSPTFQAAALAGVASNEAYPLTDRLTAAIQALDLLLGDEGEIGEMSTEDQLRNELRDVRHDLEHVAGERDEALRKLALADELLAAYEREPASKQLVEHILANQKLAKRADQLEDLLRATVPVLAYVSSGRTPRRRSAVPGRQGTQGARADRRSDRIGAEAVTDPNEQIHAAVSEWARTLPRSPEGPGVPDSREALQQRVDGLREQMHESSAQDLAALITDAIERATEDATSGIIQLDSSTEYWDLSGVHGEAEDIARVAHGAVQVALSNAYYWRDLARRERDEAEREVQVLQERIREYEQQIALNSETIANEGASRRHAFDLLADANFTSFNTELLLKVRVNELEERIRKALDELESCAEASDGMCGYSQRALAILSGSDTATNTKERTLPEIEVSVMNADEWAAACRQALDDVGLTYEQLAEMAARRDFPSSEARKVWLAIGGRYREEREGPNADPA